jgi:DNA polymerase III subunit chi
MGAAMFYHLTRSTPEDTATTLVTRAAGLGWRVMIRGRDAARLDRLDAHLWLHPENSFLPHGRQGGARDAMQHVLLGTGPITNAATALMLLDGADATLNEIRALTRLWLIFDGQDDASVAQARAQWKTLTDAGIAAQYWSEETGKWQMKAEKQANPIKPEID